MKFIEPVWWNEDWVTPQSKSQWIKSAKYDEYCYKELLNWGWKAQHARDVLPNALKTEVVQKGNLREWRHIFSLRCDKPAHPQMRDLMLGLLSELRKSIPIIFDDLDIKFEL